MSKPTFSIGYYRIEYANGFIQHKHLIPQDTYDTIMNRRNNRHPIQSTPFDQEAAIGKYFFTTRSPLHDAIQSGIVNGMGVTIKQIDQ